MIDRRHFLLSLMGTVGAGQLSPKWVHAIEKPHAENTIHQPNITAKDEFYAHCATDEVPHITKADWRLKLSGLVNRPSALTLDDLLTLPQVETMRTIECGGNQLGGHLIGNAMWRGVRLRDVLLQVGIQSKARFIRFISADGYETGIDLKSALHQDTVLAYAMNNEPLSPEKGFPLRLLSVGHYGYKMPKWITNIEILDQPHDGFWESQGWSQSGSVATRAAFTTPQTYSQVRGETIRLMGYAFGGVHAITEVEVRLDGGRWMPADLVLPPTSLAWTGWYLDWEPAITGLVGLEVRAKDASGFVQSDTPPKPITLRASDQSDNSLHKIF